MVDKKLVALGVDIAKNNPSANFNIEQMQDTFRKAVAELVSDETGSIDFYKWTKNKNEIFELMSEILTEVEPMKLTRAFEQFADVKRVNHGQKARYLVKKGRKGVKRFVTKVAAAGVYERVRLDRDYMDVDTYAHGGAIYQTLEGFLRGAESITEVLDIFMYELEEMVYGDILTALGDMATRLPSANKALGAAFSKASFDNILNVVAAYGRPVIITTRAFAQTNLVPDDGWVSDMAREEMRTQGYLGKYNGADVVILEQTFADNTNAVKRIEEDFAYIIPAGANEKPIKVSLEGDVMIRDVQREDWSTEMQIYRKLGVAVLSAHNIGIFRVRA